MLRRVIAAAALAALVAGCVGDGGKITEGTDLSVGMSIPGTDGEMSLTIFNYLSGFRLGVEEGSRITLEYSVSETNDYCGLIHTRVSKAISATITPVVDEEDAEDGVEKTDDGAKSETKD